MRELIAERRVWCKDKKTQEGVTITFRIFRLSPPPRPHEPMRMAEFAVEDDFAGGDIELPGTDDVHALGLCLLHIESFLLHLSILHDVMFDNGIPFDPESHSVLFGAEQRKYRERHLSAGSLQLPEPAKDQG